MSRQKALIVDDEPDIRELLEITLGRMKLDTCCARNLKEARDCLARERFDLCLTDMRLPDGTGMELVQYMQQRHPQVPVAMITAYGSLDTAINALKAGAFDYLTKPVDLPRLRELVNTALRLQQASSNEKAVDSRLIGDSPPMKALRKQIDKLARSQAPVYISGESGSGKELVARQIHDLGPRAERPFVPVNCGAIPSELMESEFFGHRKGSFTGAIEDKQGLFQAANGGTLFLDEVGELPLSVQAKLLRTLQNGEIQRLGTDQPRRVDVRIIAATNRNLQQSVRDGLFRADLYHRLSVYPAPIPPLRERGNDVLLLAGHFLELNRTRLGLRSVRLSSAAEQALLAYAWPGNVRELEHVISRAALRLLSRGGERGAILTLEPELLDLDSAALPPAVSTPQSSGVALPVSAPQPLRVSVDACQRQAIRQALEAADGSWAQAARLLELDPSNLHKLARRLGMK